MTQLYFEFVTAAETKDLDTLLRLIPEHRDLTITKERMAGSSMSSITIARSILRPRFRPA